MSARDDLMALLNVAEVIASNIVTLKESYNTIRSDYKRTITEAMDDYLTSSESATRYKGIFKRSANEAIPEAFYIGYENGGGDRDDVERDADDWLTSRMNQEIGFIDQLFISLKQMRDEFIAGDVKVADLRDASQQHAMGYVDTLDAIYNAGMMWGAKNKILTWRYGDTEHCDTCKKLNGQSHKSAWYISRNYIPRQPGAAMDCGGYRCQCSLHDKDGNEFTL